MFNCLLAKNMAKFLHNLTERYTVTLEFEDLSKKSKEIELAKYLKEKLDTKCETILLDKVLDTNQKKRIQDILNH